MCLHTCVLGTELSSPYCRILLTPDLSEALSMPKSKEQFLSHDLSTGTNAPSLGLLIQHLKECTEGYFMALEAYQQHSKKLESRGKLSSDEMRQVCTLSPSSLSPSPLSLSHTHTHSLPLPLTLTHTFPPFLYSCWMV